MSLKSSSALCSLAVALLALAPIAHADILASDHFDLSSYTVGALSGQTVGGTGFTGAWSQISTGDLSIVAPGQVGRPSVTTGNAGDRALFANGGFTVTSGQLFLSYDMTTSTPLDGTRLDLNIGNVAQAAYLGGLSNTGNFNFRTSAAFGSVANAQTNISEVGAHHLVGVLDFTNNQISIFVDPSASSFYYTNGANNANASAVWTAAVSPTLTSYSLIDNLSNQATFDNVVFSTDGRSVGVAGTPEPGSVALLVGMGTTGAGCFVRRRRKARKSA